MREAPIQTDGEVIQVLKPELCEVRLPNGKTTLGHLSRKLRSDAPTLVAGQKVRMEMTPFDFDTGRIVAIVD